MSVYLSIYVIPNSSRNQVVGFVGDRLKVKLMMAPEKGRANKHVTRLLAETLSVPVSDITVVRGQTHTSKTLIIQGVSEGEISAKLSRFRN